MRSWRIIVSSEKPWFLVFPSQGYLKVELKSSPSRGLVKVKSGLFKVKVEVKVKDTSEKTKSRSQLKSNRIKVDVEFEKPKFFHFQVELMSSQISVSSRTQLSQVSVESRQVRTKSHRGQSHSFVKVESLSFSKVLLSRVKVEIVFTSQVK